MKLICARLSEHETAHNRMAWDRLGFALAYVLVAIRLVDLTIIQGEMQPPPEQAVAEAILPVPEPVAACS